MSTGARARLLLHRYGRLVAVVCLVVALGAGFMAVSAYGDVPTETVTQEIDVEEFSFESHTEATVDGPNITLYEPGDRLVDMPVYFHDESPTMDLLIDLDGPEGATLEVIVTAELEATRDDRPFYEETVLLGADSVTIDGDESVTSVLIDVPHIQNRIDRVEQQASTVGSLDESIRVEVSYESERYDGTLTDTVGIQIGANGYWLEDDPGDSDRHSDVVVDEVTGDRDMTSVVLFAALALVSVVGGVGAALYTRQFIDTERLKTEIAIGEFDEWISTGEIPTRATKQYVKVSSLEDVVDIAIDSNKRVIHDPELDAFGVIDGDLVYYYSPGADEIEEWLEL